MCFTELLIFLNFFKMVNYGLSIVLWPHLAAVLSPLIVLTNRSASCPACQDCIPCPGCVWVQPADQMSLVVCRDKCDKTQDCGHRYMAYC